MSEQELIEQLADKEHASWSRWNVAKLASDAGLCYNRGIDIVVAQSVLVTLLSRVTTLSLRRRIATMDTVPPHAQKSNSTPETTFIYGLKDPDTQLVRYIGKSDNPQQRLKYHLNEKGSTRKLNWLKNLKKRGLLPEVVILEKIPSEHWKERERYWIAYGREQGWPLVNGTDGGEGASGLILSEESCLRISERLNGHIVLEETRQKISQGLLGHAHSEATRQKISQKQRGKQGKSPASEVRQKISETLQGHPVSSETRQKISKELEGKPAYNKGQPLSEEQRRKISEGNKGKQIPEEIRRKISETTRGRKKPPFSEEHKRNLSEAHKGKGKKHE